MEREGVLMERGYMGHFKQLAVALRDRTRRKGTTVAGLGKKNPKPPSAEYIVHLAPLSGGLLLYIVLCVPGEHTAPGFAAYGINTEIKFYGVLLRRLHLGGVNHRGGWGAGGGAPHTLPHPRPVLPGVLSSHCFRCKVSVLLSALYAKCPYY